MPEARVESIDSLKSFKTALLKFAESANVALADAESEVLHTINWLENEQTTYWQMQFRKRTELVGRCKEAVRMKRIYKDSSGRPQSAVEEEKALKIAIRQLEEAEQKNVAVRKAVKRMEKEAQLYKGMVQRFATDVAVEVPSAASLLENLLRSLRAYTALDTPVEVTSTAPIESTSAAIGTETGGSMTRSVEEMNRDGGDKPVEAQPEEHESPETGAQ